MKTLVLAAFMIALGACATADPPMRSYTPEVDVIVKAPRIRTAQANYQVSPEQAALTGAGGFSK